MYTVFVNNNKASSASVENLTWFHLNAMVWGWSHVKRREHDYEIFAFTQGKIRNDVLPAFFGHYDSQTVK